MDTTADLFPKYSEIFQNLRSRFRYITDRKKYSVEEHWMVPDEIRSELESNGYLLGDCDDFATYVVTFLRGNGYPARYVLCIDETDSTHLVAESHGWIFDNRQGDVIQRDKLDYRWISISGFNPGDFWHKIKYA